MKNTDFDFGRIAEGYKNRPFLHKQVIEEFQRINGNVHFENGLDIGCGAGLSTKALAEICEHTVGIDISKEMVGAAKEVCCNCGNIEYYVSSAEEYKQNEVKFDVVTAAGAVQWMDMTSFLINMGQMMKIGGYLLIYDFAISDEMVGDERYTNWWHEQYLKEFPKPYRNEKKWEKEEVAKYGFTTLCQTESRMKHVFDLESLVEFMMIQSNVNAQIEGGGRNVNEVRKWFFQTLTPIFQNNKKELVFKGYNWCFQKE